MQKPNDRASWRYGCNVVDPLLAVGPGSDYSLEVMRRSLEFSAQLGFQAVEYSHALHWSDEQALAVHELTRQLGLGAWSLHAWADGDVLVPQNAARTAQILKRAGELALILGVTCVVHHPCGSSLEQDGRRLQVEADVIRSAWQPGFRYALENMSTVAQAEYTVALIDELGMEVAGMCVDTGHAHLGRELGPARALRMAGHRLITTHLHDNHGQRDEHLPPGDGAMDWPEIAAVLREIGYRGCILLELTDHPSEDRRAAYRQEVARGAQMARWLADEVLGPA